MEPFCHKKCKYGPPWALLLIYSGHTPIDSIYTQQSVLQINLTSGVEHKPSTLLPCAATQLFSVALFVPFSCPLSQQRQYRNQLLNTTITCTLPWPMQRSLYSHFKSLKKNQLCTIFFYQFILTVPQPRIGQLPTQPA